MTMILLQDVNSKLPDAISVADVGAKECVDDNLVKILKLKIGKDFEANFSSRL